MSTKITEILGPDGETIYIQYDDEDTDDLRAVGYIDDIQERTDQLKTLPSKVTLEFGLQAGGETGVSFVTKGSAQANVKVTIE